jgi:Icc protein
MKSIRLLQFTDTHIKSDPAGELRGVTPLKTLQATMAHAAQRFAAADAILLTGDVVHDDVGGYRLVKQMFANSAVPVHCIPGNHDVPAAMKQELAQAPFQVSSVAVMHPWVICKLNTWIENSASGRVGAEQLHRLDETLATHAGLHALVCLHHHPLATGSRWLDEVSLEDSRAFLDIIGKHPNVRGVLWGHVHQAFDCFMKGVRYMATPATCMQFLPHSDDFAVDQRPPGYRALELQPDGSIATEVLWLHEGMKHSLHWTDHSAKSA